ncbi:MAG: deoxyribodipyrimidine photolyase [Thermodesulfobacteriota bacterium]
MSSGAVGAVPAHRVRAANRQGIRRQGEYVLYWMTAFRRASWNFALQQAGERARELGRPLLVLEALRCAYPHASDRLHRFVLDGMGDNRERFREAGIAYRPYAEPFPGEGTRLLAALAERACLVVADDSPAFFLPRMVAAAAARLPVLVEAVDANGLLPLGAADRPFGRAVDFRRFLQRTLREHLALPVPNPLGDLPGRAEVPEDVQKRWPEAPPSLLRPGASLAAFPIDHRVAPAPCTGGERAGRERLREFIAARLPRYAEDRNHPDRDATSGLSPYLHFGHLCPHQVFAAVMEHEGWSEDLLGPKATGKRTGWWGVGESAEAFLDQLVVWRELGFNGCARGAAWDRYESLPPWARAALERHAADRRPYRYSRDELEAAATHDPLWNAAQTQLLREGRIHTYLRMLWGKKILEWTPSPREAWDTLLHLNDRYALDGRDPNSLTGIAWCLGRYDRPWPPDRPVFGTVRTMSSENTARKVEVKEYRERYAPPSG